MAAPVRREGFTEASDQPEVLQAQYTEVLKKLGIKIDDPLDVMANEVILQAYYQENRAEWNRYLELVSQLSEILWQMAEQGMHTDAYNAWQRLSNFHLGAQAAMQLLRVEEQSKNTPR